MELIVANKSTVIISEQEIEMAKLFANGLTRKEVGAELYMTAAVVMHKIDALKERVGARNTTHLITILFRKKLIE